ncbi:ABC transporter permease [Kamptonema cortianum]|nr:ABC transporter permease [Geitlerinema splendidum]MDK3158467.1 ABC transporter permease [Kamptonema cortianum]
MKLRLVVLLIFGLGLIIAALVLSKQDPLTALKTMFSGAVGTPQGWRDTLKESTPLLILGAAVFIGLRAGLFNIGAEGQFLLGAVAATYVATQMTGLPGIVCSILAAVVAGALWAFPAGWIKAHKGGHEVITTIMLNSIAGFLTLALVKGPMKDPAESSPTTAFLDESVVLPVIFKSGPFRLNLAFLLALILVVALWIYFKKTVSGYELRAVGGNPGAAETAGVNVKKVIQRAMLVSGGIAGLAGAIQVLAHEKRFYSGFSPGYGFDALGVALLAGQSPLALIGSGLIFGVIANGTTILGLTGVPKGLASLMLGVLVIGFAAFKYRREVTHD